jgi:hypothetical protein
MEQPLPSKMLSFLTILMMTTAAALVSTAMALPPLEEQAATLLA